jgi:hypothetical protein
MIADLKDQYDFFGRFRLLELLLGADDAPLTCSITEAKYSHNYKFDLFYPAHQPAKNKPLVQFNTGTTLHISEVLHDA